MPCLLPFFVHFPNTIHIRMSSSQSKKRKANRKEEGNEGMTSITTDFIFKDTHDSDKRTKKKKRKNDYDSARSSIAQCSSTSGLDASASIEKRKKKTVKRKKTEPQLDLMMSAEVEEIEPDKNDNRYNDIYWPGSAAYRGPNRTMTPPKKAKHTEREGHERRAVLDQLQQISRKLDTAPMVGVLRPVGLPSREEECKVELANILGEQMERMMEGKEKWTPHDNRLVRKRNKKGVTKMSDKQVMQHAASLTTLARRSSMPNYLSSMRAWRTFCTESAFDWRAPTEMSLLHYTIWRYSGGLAAESMKKEYGKIRTLLSDIGASCPRLRDLPAVRGIVRGIAMMQALEDPKEKRYPLTPVHLRDMLPLLALLPWLSENEKLYIGAMWKVSLFALMRVSEVLKKRIPGGWSQPIRWSHVTFYACSKTKKNYVIIRLPPSKTDRTGKEFNIVLEMLEEEHANICPVRALQQLHAYRKDNSDSEVFENMEGKVKLTYRKYTRALKDCLKAAGYDDSRYHTHSWRIGGATVARAMGFTDGEIKILGRWKSQAFMVYTRPCLEHQGRLAARLQDWDYKLAFS